MTSHLFRKISRVVVMLAAFAAPATAAKYILALNAGANISQVDARHGLVLVRSLSEDNRTVFLVTGPDPAPPLFVEEVREDPAVHAFEPDVEVVSHETPPASKPMIDLTALTAAIQNHSALNYYGVTVRASYVQQPSAALIELPAALASFGDGSTIVAVIDTGVDPNHPALKGILVPGYDFTRNQPGYASELADLSQSTVAILDQSTVAILDSKKYPMALNQSTVAILDQSTVAILDGPKLPSDFGHGTMVSGLIHLVAPGARIMPLKAFSSDGSANLSDIVRAVYYAVDNGAKVINMSFSSLTQFPSVTAAMQYAWSHNVICVASAGNDGKHEIVYPAGDKGVIGVGSTTDQDRRSFFSNYGEGLVRIAAPGEALITSYPGNNYAGVWGTSFSTALTSGGVALLLQLSPRGQIEELGDILEHGHRLDIDGMGDSRLDVLSMLQYYQLHK